MDGVKCHGVHTEAAQIAAAKRDPRAGGRVRTVLAAQVPLPAWDHMDLANLEPVGHVEMAMHGADVARALSRTGLGGTQLHGFNVAIHGDTLACQYSRGLTFVDVSDPANLAVRAPANFGTTISTAPGGTLAFTRDGTKAIVPVIWPNSCIYAFDVTTGDQVATPFSVTAYPQPSLQA